jgi:hypothetical protein
MTFQTIVNNSRTGLAHFKASKSYQTRLFIHTRPLAAAGILLLAGLALGIAGRSVAGMAQVSLLQAKANVSRSSWTRSGVAPSRKSTPWPRAWANCRPRPTASMRSANA